MQRSKRRGGKFWLARSLGDALAAGLLAGMVGCGAPEAAPAATPAPTTAPAVAAQPVAPVTSRPDIAAEAAVPASPAAPADPHILGLWIFDHCDAHGQVANARPQGGGVPAVLMEFAPAALAGTDSDLAPFSIVRNGATQSVQVNKSGWATFAGVPDNGLEPGVNTPVGKRALALFAAKPGNWIHFPGLASALVDHPGGAAGSFGIAMWVLVQTEWKNGHAEFPTMNPLLRFATTDGRFFLMPAPADRLYTEDVGNGLGGGYGYQIPWARREAAVSRWVLLAYSADAATHRFEVWVNGEPVNYRDPKAHDRPWPAGGGMQLNFKPGEASDGAVMGRWLGGAGAPGKTIGIASVLILKDEALSQARAQYLFKLGRRGVPFDGRWPADAK
ncbi:MAG: hypothetical protein ACREJ2_07575 [Planctomycetota bacterium]